MSLIERRDAGFLAYWVMIHIMRRLPLSFRLRHATTASRICARIWLLLSPHERERTLTNLKLMFDGQHNDAELERINVAHHESHVWSLLMPDVVTQLSPSQIRCMSEVRGKEHLESVLAAGRGALLLSGHVGTHGYVIVAALMAHGYAVTAVTGRESTPIGQDQPDGSWLYRKLIHPVREEPRAVLPFLTRNLVPDRRIADVFQRNEILLIQADMHLTREQVMKERHLLWMPFLWGCAPFRSGPIRLPRLFQAPVLPTFAYRQGSHLVIEIEEPLSLHSGTGPEALMVDMGKFLKRLEYRILSRPDQWAFTRHENLTRWIQPRLDEVVGS